MPLTGPDPFVSDVSWRKFCRDHLLGIETFQYAVDDSLGAEILGTVDAELKFCESRVLDHVLGQEILRPKSEIAPAARDNVHWRGADEGGNETIGRVVVDLRRRYAAGARWNFVDNVAA